MTVTPTTRADYVPEQPQPTRNQAKLYNYNSSSFAWDPRRPPDEGTMPSGSDAIIAKEVRIYYPTAKAPVPATFVTTTTPSRLLFTADNLWLTKRPKPPDQTVVLARAPSAVAATVPWADTGEEFPAKEKKPTSIGSNADVLNPFLIAFTPSAWSDLEEDFPAKEKKPTSIGSNTDALFPPTTPAVVVTWSDLEEDFPAKEKKPTSIGSSADVLNPFLIAFTPAAWSDTEEDFPAKEKKPTSIGSSTDALFPPTTPVVVITWADLPEELPRLKIRNVLSNYITDEFPQFPTIWGVEPSQLPKFRAPVKVGNFTIQPIFPAPLTPAVTPSTWLADTLLTLPKRVKVSWRLDGYAAWPTRTPVAPVVVTEVHFLPFFSTLGQMKSF